jgi:CheY-like chemotaxis protein
MKSILIIVREDMRTRFSDIVSDAGYHAITADSVDAAVHLATSKSPNLVLLAIVMPELNGLQTAARLRSLPVTRDIPIVLLGSLPPVGLDEEPLASLVDGYLEWDAPADELIACVTRYARTFEPSPTDNEVPDS